jgi:hypothetical protein
MRAAVRCVVEGAVLDSIDEAYRAKYRGNQYLERMIGPRPARDPWDHTNQREQVMNTMQLFLYGASVLATALGGAAVAQETGGQYVQVAEIEVDPAQLDAYRAAVQEQIEAAIQKEPGVLVLYAVSEKEEPNHEGLRNLPRQDRLRSSPRIGSFQEIQGDGGDDGEVTQAGAGDTDRARCEIGSWHSRRGWTIRVDV